MMLQYLIALLLLLPYGLFADQGKALHVSYVRSIIEAFQKEYPEIPDINTVDVVPLSHERDGIKTGMLACTHGADFVDQEGKTSTEYRIEVDQEYLAQAMQEGNVFDIHFTIAHELGHVVHQDHQKFAPAGYTLYQERQWIKDALEKPADLYAKKLCGAAQTIAYWQEQVEKSGSFTDFSKEEKALLEHYRGADMIAYLVGLPGEQDAVSDFFIIDQNRYTPKPEFFDFCKQQLASV